MKYNRKVRGTPDAMQVIFIGDSYGTGYGITPTTNNWIDYCANILGSSGGYRKFEYKKAASNGAGFSVSNTNSGCFHTNSHTCISREIFCNFLPEALYKYTISGLSHP